MDSSNNFNKDRGGAQLPAGNQGGNGLNRFPNADAQAFVPGQHEHSILANNATMGPQQWQRELPVRQRTEPSSNNFNEGHGGAQLLTGNDGENGLYRFPNPDAQAFVPGQHEHSILDHSATIGQQQWQREFSVRQRTEPRNYEPIRAQQHFPTRDWKTAKNYSSSNGANQWKGTAGSHQTFRTSLNVINETNESQKEPLGHSQGAGFSRANPSNIPVASPYRETNSNSSPLRINSERLICEENALLMVKENGAYIFYLFDHRKSAFLSSKSPLAKRMKDLAAGKWFTLWFAPISFMKVASARVDFIERENTTPLHLVNSRTTLSMENFPFSIRLAVDLYSKNPGFNDFQSKSENPIVKTQDGDLVLLAPEIQLPTRKVCSWEAMNLYGEKQWILAGRCQLKVAMVPKKMLNEKMKKNDDGEKLVKKYVWVLFAIEGAWDTVEFREAQEAKDQA